MIRMWLVWSEEVSVIWPIALWLGYVPDGLLLWLLIVCSWSEPGRPVGPAGGGPHAQPAQGRGPGVCVPQQGQCEWGQWEHESLTFRCILLQYVRVSITLLLSTVSILAHVHVWFLSDHVCYHDSRIKQWGILSPTGGVFNRPRLKLLLVHAVCLSYCGKVDCLFCC